MAYVALWLQQIVFFCGHSVEFWQSQRIFSIILFRTHEILYNLEKEDFGGPIPESTQDKTAIAFQMKPV